MFNSTCTIYFTFIYLVDFRYKVMRRLSFMVVVHPEICLSFKDTRGVVSCYLLKSEAGC